MSEARTKVDPGLEVITRYLAAMDRFDVEEILDCFSEDVQYGHPRVVEMEPSATRPYLVGRDQLRKFLEYRGKEDSTHYVTAFARGEVNPGPETGESEGSYCFAAGTGRNQDQLVSFCTVYQLDEDGRIQRYSPHVATPYFNLQVTDEYTSRYTPGR